MKQANSDHISALAGAIGAAVIGLAAGATAYGAEAASPEVLALTQPTSTVQVGGIYVSDPSFKFGEYNGLQSHGGYLLGNFDLLGGGSYDSDSAARWRIKATDLGTDARNFQAEIGVQGKFRISIGYDQLRHNAPTGDSFLTPYRGAGSNLLTLPGNWILPVVPRVSTTAANARGLSAPVDASSAIVTGVLTAPTPAQATQAAALLAADLPAFNGYQLYTERRRYDAALSLVMTPKWEFSAAGRRDDRTGAKAMGTVTRQTGGDISTTLPDPIDQSTDQLTLSLGYKNHKDFVQLGYSASLFHNNIATLSWQNWAVSATTPPNPTMATMSSAPSNQSHQVSLAAGHDLNAYTRLAVNGSLTRNTQNDAFYVDASTPWVPVGSLNGKVSTTNLAIKLTSRPTKQFNFGVGYKYDDRNNSTAVNNFVFLDAQEPAGATAINAAFGAALGVPANVLALLKSNVNINANRPYSRKLGELSADAEYRFTPGEALRAGFVRQSIDRWCTGSWISCIDAANTSENSFTLELRSTLSDALHTRFGYTGANRKVDAYNENAFLALVPMANVSPTGATGGVSAYGFMLANGWNGYGPAAGYAATTGNANLFFPLNNAMANAMYQNANRISELPGMRRYNMANRDRNRMHGELDWQAGQKFSVQAGGDYRRDKYSDSRYGLLEERDWSANLEGVFAASENFNIVVYYTHEDQQQKSAGNTYTANSAAANVGGFTAISGGCYATIALRNASNKIDPCLDWGAAMGGLTNVYGFSLDRKGLLPSHKLDVKLTGTWSRARSGNNVTGGNYVNNPYAAVTVPAQPAGTIAAYYIPATPLPAVTSDVLELRFNAAYALSKVSSLRLGYLYADYSSADYAYAGLQYGGLAGVLPTSQAAPSYKLSVVSLSYAARF